MAQDDIALGVLVQHEIMRRAQRLWRIVSIVVGVAFGAFGWWILAAAAFGFFQFLAYATRWHTVRDVERATGLSEGQQELLIAAATHEIAAASVREQMLAIRPLDRQEPFINRSNRNDP